MLFLRNLGYFPSAFRNRNKLISKVLIQVSGKKPEDDGSITITANCNNHNTTINILQPNSKTMSPVKISCDCQSFIYDFQVACYKVGSLYGVNNISFVKNPKERNPHVIASGCKHIHALARLILKNNLF